MLFLLTYNMVGPRRAFKTEAFTLLFSIAQLLCTERTHSRGGSLGWRGHADGATGPSRSRFSSAAISDGKGASNRRLSPVTGCSNPRTAAWSA